MSARGRSRLAGWAGVLGVVALGASAVLLWQRPAATTDAYLSDVETVRVAVTGVPATPARDVQLPRPAAQSAETPRRVAPQVDAPAPAQDAPAEDASATGSTTLPSPEAVPELVDELVGEPGDEQSGG